MALSTISIALLSGEFVFILQLRFDVLANQAMNKTSIGYTGICVVNLTKSKNQIKCSESNSKIRYASIGQNEFRHPVLSRMWNFEPSPYIPLAIGVFSFVFPFQKIENCFLNCGR